MESLPEIAEKSQESSRVSNDSIIWRCISYRPFSSGMTGFSLGVMYDDMVSTERLSSYFEQLLDRRVEKVTVKKLGTLDYVMQKQKELGFDHIRSGADRISHEKKNHKLEEYLYE